MVRYQQGDYAAFETLYRRHGGAVLGYLRRHLSAPGEAEDLLQTVFLKLHQSRRRYDRELPFLPWLFSITRNVLIDALRRKRPTPVPAEVLEAAPAPEPTPSLADALKGLPEDQRRLLELRFGEGLSFEEISRRTGVNATAVRKRVSRAMGSLKRLFGGGENE